MKEANSNCCLQDFFGFFVLDPSSNRGDLL